MTTPKSLHRLLCILILLGGPAAAAESGGPAPGAAPDGTAAGLTADHWSEDLDFVVERVETLHPDPFTKISPTEWLRQVDAVRGGLPDASDGEIAVQFMQLVSLIGDGHTNLWPSGEAGFTRWYPIRFYEFSDGYFVTAIDRDLGEHVGAEVVALNGVTIVEVAHQARTLRSADNQMAQMESTYYLSSATALEALGLAEPGAALEISLIDQNGQRRTIQLPAMEGKGTLAWSWWGEMFGPLFEDPEQLVTGFDKLAPMQYRDQDDTRPPHLRSRDRYAFWVLPDRDAIYAQINFLIDSDDNPFEEGFMKELFDAIDRTEVDKLVLDLRYNGGGDGSMAIPFVHELIKRDHSVNQPGRLYLLVGRKTFSAAIMLLDQFDDHTAALFVGEPSRAPFNHFGDPTDSKLPHSKMTLSVSNRFWQLSTSDDTSTQIPINYPAPFSSTEYFGGLDPALEAILSGTVQPIPQLISDEGATTAREVITPLIDRYGTPDWWKPFSLRDMRRMGRDLIDAGRIEDGLYAYQLNTLFYADSWRVWDSLGDGYYAAGQKSKAKGAFERALSLKSDNWNADHQREMIAQLSAQ